MRFVLLVTPATLPRLAAELVPLAPYQGPPLPAPLLGAQGSRAGVPVTSGAIAAFIEDDATATRRYG